MTHSTEPAERTCPGYHPPEHQAPGLRPDEHLCRRCVDRTMHYLRDLLGDLHELDRTTSRQATLGSAAPGHRSKGDEQPLPFHPTAAERTHQIDGFLYEWAWFVADRRGRPLPRVDRGRVHFTKKRATTGNLIDPAYAPAVYSAALTRGERVLAVRTLIDARNWLRTDQQGPMLADTIAQLRAKARATVDRYEHRWYAGPCRQPTTVIDLDDVEDADGKTTIKATARNALCDFDLYGEPGKAVIVCDGYRDPSNRSGCGAYHPAIARKQFLIRSLEDEWLPLDMILAALPSLLGVNPDRATVRQWRQRRKLRPVLETDAGVKLYRGGDVMDLAADTQPRPGPKRQDKTERRIGA